MFSLLVDSTLDRKSYFIYHYYVITEESLFL